MKKFYYIQMVLIVVLSTVAESWSSSNYSKSELLFDLSSRPHEVSNAIDTEFNKLSLNKVSSWGLTNGQSEYTHLKCDDRKLIYKTIKDSCLEQKEFHILDIGGGNHQWVNNMAEYINQNFSEADITVNLYSVGGETFTLYTPRIKEKTIIHEIGNFKVEELEAEFLKRGLLLNNNIDLIYSNYCLHHLVDPVGTLIQAVNLLRPHKGIMISTGFHYLDSRDTLESYMKATHIIRIQNALNLLQSLQYPYLLHIPTNRREVGFQFAINRINAAPCLMPFKYKGLCIDNEIARLAIGSQAICLFKTDIEKSESKVMQALYDISPENPTICKRKKLNNLDFYGNKLFFNWFNENRLFFPKEEHVEFSYPKNASEEEKEAFENSMASKFSGFQKIHKEKDEDVFVLEIHEEPTHVMIPIEP